MLDNLWSQNFEKKVQSCSTIKCPCGSCKYCEKYKATLLVESPQNPKNTTTGACRSSDWLAPLGSGSMYLGLKVYTFLLGFG